MSPERFREIRMALGLTQDDLVLVLGVSEKSVISRYENGERRPSKLVSALMEILASMPTKDAERLMTLLKKYLAKEQESDA